MTEYELGELMHGQSAQMWQAGQMYFTLVSTYLVVAYLAGEKLTRSQVSVITVLYLVWVAAVVSGQVTSGAEYVRLEGLLREQGSLAVGSSASPTEFNSYTFLFVQIAGVIASLWFIWSVRHPKTE